RSGQTRLQVATRKGLADPNPLTRVASPLLLWALPSRLFLSPSLPFPCTVAGERLGRRRRSAPAGTLLRGKQGTSGTFFLPQSQGCCRRIGRKDLSFIRKRRFLIANPNLDLLVVESSIFYEATL
ncbi:hypothetical protein U9M48_020753, partial [Paspalum notatum var. saurae]